MRLRAIYPALVGLLLGTLQTGLYFQLTFTLSSSFGTYLLLILCWLTGSMIGVVWVTRLSMSTNAVLLLALGTYAVCGLLLLAMPFDTNLFPLYGGLIVLVGVYPGVFFGRAASLYRAEALFFRENNGFIVGLVFGTLLFMLFGRFALWIPPGVLAGWLLLEEFPARDTAAGTDAP